MNTTTLTDTSSGVTPHATRTEVLAQLRAAGRPLTVADVAALMDVHVNTARFHLDALVEDELAERTVEERATPGRPRILYRAQGRVPGPRSYGLLAEMLTGLVGSMKDAGPAGLQTGNAWGAHLIERVAPSQQVDADDAVSRLTRLLAAIGFQPKIRRVDRQQTDVELHHCPFREVAEQHTDVVCAIHLGLMQGALGELRAPVEATALDPFVTPQLCVARLRTTATDHSATRRFRASKIPKEKP